jgi:hypothetical protein
MFRCIILFAAIQASFGVIIEAYSDNACTTSVSLLARCAGAFTRFILRPPPLLSPLSHCPPPPSDRQPDQLCGLRWLLQHHSWLAAFSWRRRRRQLSGKRSGFWRGSGRLHPLRHHRGALPKRVQQPRLEYRHLPMHQSSCRNCEPGLGWAVRAGLFESLPNLRTWAAILEASRDLLRPSCALWRQHWCLLLPPVHRNVPLQSPIQLLPGARNHHGRLRSQHYLVELRLRLSFIWRNINRRDISRQCIQSCSLQQQASIH